MPRYSHPAAWARSNSSRTSLTLAMVTTLRPGQLEPLVYQQHVRLRRKPKPAALPRECEERHSVADDHASTHAIVSTSNRISCKRPDWSGIITRACCNVSSGASHASQEVVY